MKKIIKKTVFRVKSLFWTSLSKCFIKSYGGGLGVNAKSWFRGNVTCKNNCNFNGMEIIGVGSVVFGNNFHSGSGCKIVLGSHDYDNDDAIPYGRRMVKKTCIIEDNVWFGINAMVCGNVHIEEGAILAAGAVVVKDVPKCAIVGGNPAKVIKYRDIEHYEKLKKEGKFN